MMAPATTFPNDCQGQPLNAVEQALRSWGGPSPAWGCRPYSPASVVRAAARHWRTDTLHQRQDPQTPPTTVGSSPVAWSRSKYIGSGTTAGL